MSAASAAAGERHAAASRRVDASARVIARELLANRNADLEGHLRIHRENVEAEAAARAAWMDARAVAESNNDSRNGR